MTQLFMVDSPERLRQLTALSKEGNPDSIARVWNASRRQNGGESAFDGRIIVSLYTEGRRKNASVVLLRKNKEPDEIMRLKYAQTLRFCWDRLRAIRT